MEHESDSDTNCTWCARYSHQRIGTGAGRLGNKSMRGDHPNYNIIEIGQNTEKSPGDLKRLIVAVVIGGVVVVPNTNHLYIICPRIIKMFTICIQNKNYYINYRKSDKKKEKFWMKSE